MKVIGRLVAVVLALALAGLLLEGLGTSSFDAAALVLSGTFGSWSALAYVMTAWAPLLLCASGLLVTFEAGLWNIGIEGQVVMGAVSAAGFLRLAGAAPPWLALILSACAGAAGGAAWALVAGALKRYGRVNEIFGGLGLNFIAGGLTVYLVVEAWKRAGIGSTSGTEPLRPALWLPAPAGFPVSPWEVGLALAAIVLVSAALAGTRFGLCLKAIGRNARAASIRGCATERHLLLAFAAGGAAAGMAGWMLLVGASARHNLFPLISGGYGFLAILVVLLSGRRVLWTIAVSFFFAAVSMGGLQLALERQLDSSLGGVIQGFVVLSVLLAGGVADRQRTRRSRWTS